LRNKLPAELIHVLGGQSASIRGGAVARVDGYESETFKVQNDLDGSYFDTAQAMLHADAHEEGGLGFTNKELLTQQRGWGSLFAYFKHSQRMRGVPLSLLCIIAKGDSSRRAIVDIAKDVGRKLLTGSLNLINLSMPVRMFEDRSYLQKLADVWVYPRYVKSLA